MTDDIENRTFDELEVGDSASVSHVLTKQDIQLFAVMSGDVNPLYVKIFSITVYQPVVH